MKSLFLEDDEVVDDRLSIQKKNTVKVHEIKRYIDTLKSNKVPGSDGIKAEIYQKTSDITALLLTQIVKDYLKKGYFPIQYKKAELSYTKVEIKIKKMQSRIDLYAY